MSENGFLSCGIAAVSRYGNTMTSLPAYDAWKLETPPYLEDAPEPNDWDCCDRCGEDYSSHLDKHLPSCSDFRRHEDGPPDPNDLWD
jgi:hypothetical protein